MQFSDPNWRKKSEVLSGSYWELGAFNGKLHARYVRKVQSDNTLVVDYSTTKSWINSVRWGNRVEYAWRDLPKFLDLADEVFPHGFKHNLRGFLERGTTP